MNQRCAIEDRPLGIANAPGLGRCPLQILGFDLGRELGDFLRMRMSSGGALFHELGHLATQSRRFGLERCERLTRLLFRLGEASPQIS